MANIEQIFYSRTVFHAKILNFKKEGEIMDLQLRK